MRISIPLPQAINLSIHKCTHKENSTALCQKCQPLKICAGETHTLLLMNDEETIYSFGNNQQGQLGHGRNYSENSGKPR